MRYRFRSSYLLCLLTLLFLGLPQGCGSGGGGGETAATGGGAPGPTSTVTLTHTLARTVTANVTDFRITGRNANQVVVYGPQTMPKEATVVLQDVPIAVTTLQVEYLEGTLLVGTYQQAIQLTEGGNLVLNDPAWQNADLTALLQGTYYLSAVAIRSPMGLISRAGITGPVILDGNGAVTGGTLELDDGQGTEVITDVLGGTYQVQADRSVTATINTADGTTTQLGGRVSTTGRTCGAALTQLIAVGAADEGGIAPGSSVVGSLTPSSAGIGVLVKMATGASNASLNGTYRYFAVLDDGYRHGTANMDGNGNITGGDETTQNGSTVPILGGTVQVDADGNIQGTVDTAAHPGSDLQGALGTDGTVSLGSLRLASLPPASASNGDLDGSLAAFRLTYGVTDAGFLAGTLESDGQGNLTGGMLTDSGGNDSAVTGGTYQLNPDGSLTATINTSVATYTIVAGALFQGKLLAVGVGPDSPGNTGMWLIMR